MPKKIVGILIFDEVEVLDFAGPFEVFSRTRLNGGSRRTDEDAPFEVFTIAKAISTVNAIGNMRVTPHWTFHTTPALDILLIPGGFGTRGLLNDDETLSWITHQAKQVPQLISVCTGSLLYAKCGLLKGKKATTHWAALEELSKLDRSIEVVEKVRYVDDGIVTSAGVCAGIDMSFYVVANHCGEPVAEETARYIDYPYKR